MVVDPSSKPFDSKSLSITVATNNDTGYYMTMSSDSTSLIKNNDATKTIPTLDALDGGYTESTFQNNKWGYKLGSGNFNAFVSGVEIARGDTTTNGDTTTLTFATKVDFLQAAGTYQTELNFVAVANPLPIYMQDLDLSMCTETPQKAIDLRDGEEYLIQRLADGNCWMLDNLNLGAVDLTTDLTSENTNLNDTISATAFNSWRKTSGTGTRTSAEMIPLSKSNASNGSDVDATSGTKLGTLYNYCAASAGTICTSSNSNNATYDICPSGWRLPKGGTTSDSTNEFNNLYTNSSYNTNAKMRAPVSEGGAAFALAGYFFNAAPNAQGSGGGYWSSVRGGGIGMRNLDLDTSDVYPGINSDRYYGYSVRCILK